MTSSLESESPYRELEWDYHKVGLEEETMPSVTPTWCHKEWEGYIILGDQSWNDSRHLETMGPLKWESKR